MGTETQPCAGRRCPCERWRQKLKWCNYSQEIPKIAHHHLFPGVFRERAWPGGYLEFRPADIAIVSIPEKYIFPLHHYSQFFPISYWWKDKLSTNFLLLDNKLLKIVVDIFYSVQLTCQENEVQADLFIPDNSNAVWRNA